MVEEGVLENPKVMPSMVHINSATPVGVVRYKSKGIMALHNALYDVKGNKLTVCTMDEC